MIPGAARAINKPGNLWSANMADAGMPGPPFFIGVRRNVTFLSQWGIKFIMMAENVDKGSLIV